VREREEGGGEERVVLPEARACSVYKVEIQMNP